MKILFSLFFTLFTFYTSAALYIVPTPPATKAGAIYHVIDFNSYRVLASKNEHEKREIASLTKLMTAYVAFKRLKQGFANLKDQVEISDKAYRTGGSRSFIERGELIEFETLLKGMIIQSGNDASVAVAEHIAGDEETFIKFMNHYALELGMKNTAFTNASGLPQDGHYSTAADLAILAAALIREFPVYYKWFGQKEFTHNNITQKNRNNMLWSDDSMDGLKTGFTIKAGYCLITSSKRNNMRLISVVLGEASTRARTKVTKKLLNYSFRFYETQPLAKSDEILANMPIANSTKSSVKIGPLHDISLTLPRGQFQTVKQSIKIPKDITGPFAKGFQAGSLIVKVDEDIVAQYSLYALEDAPKSGFLGQLFNTVKTYFR